jgi:hypothetical protein
MTMNELKEACRLLLRIPALWVPGIVGGLCAAVLWLVLIYSGVFFAGRLIIIAGLLLLFFITGMTAMIKQDAVTVRSLFGNGKMYYFRVLLPLLVTLFMIILVFVLVVLTLTLIGTTPDPAVIVFLSFGVALPSILLTVFADTAAVFEERKVFESIQRSVELVSVNLSQAIIFFLTSLVVAIGVIFSLMMIWEILLLEKIKPLMEYSDEQLRTLSGDQLLSLIGTEGIWVTAVVLFIAGLILIPVLVSYKTCFFRKLAGNPVVIQQVTGEYDSKGRWYKY